jgi:hypothetical protein
MVIFLLMKDVGTEFFTMDALTNLATPKRDMDK